MSCLHLHSSVGLPPTERFVVSERLKKGNKIGRFPIRFVGEGIIEHFYGVIEDACASTYSLKSWDLWSGRAPAPFG